MTLKMSKTHKATAGFYQSGTHKVIPVDKCYIQNEQGNKAIDSVVKSLNDNKISIYDEEKDRGLVQHVLVKVGYKTNEIMVIIVTKEEMFPGRNNFLKELLKLEPNIKTVIQNINPRHTSIVLGNTERILYGKGYIYDDIAGYKFKIYSKSFYQVNPRQTVKLYKKAIELARLNKNDIVLDAYSGVGTIGIMLAKSVKKVYSVELNKEAHEASIYNAKLNNINNIEFYNADCTEFMNDLVDNNVNIDVLIMDPPRTGSTEEFLNGILKLKPKKVIYISCGPDTLVRDLKVLMNDYFISTVQPVDMFARTKHVECVTLMTRKE